MCVLLRVLFPHHADIPGIGYSRYICGSTMTLNSNSKAGSGYGYQVYPVMSCASACLIPHAHNPLKYYRCKRLSV